jgi:hypothetical protein
MHGEEDDLMPPTVKTYEARNKKKPTETTGSIAFHAEGTEDHIVGIGHLRVILCKEDGFWLAQGIDIDYSASGKTQKEAKKNFEYGLESTIDQHLKIYGNIEKILIATPASVWLPLLPKGKSVGYSQLTFHDRPSEQLNDLPYSGIDWLEPSDQVAA